MNERMISAMSRLYEPVLGTLLTTLRARTVEVCEEACRISAGNPYSVGRVLDCCCGPGGVSRQLRSRGLNVVGVDLSPSMLSVAHAAAPELPLFRADAGRLPFADGSFAAAVISLALHSLDARLGDAVLAELLRVAEVVLLVDFCLAERNLEVPAGLVIHGVERLAGGDHYRNYRRFMADGGLEGLIYRHGLTVLRRAHALGGGATVAAVRGNSVSGC